MFDGLSLEMIEVNGASIRTRRAGNGPPFSVAGHDRGGRVAYSGAAGRPA
jgi:hypothetical protein